MKQIWKYVIEPDKFAYKIPKNGKILCVGEQRGDICIWVEVDSKEGLEEKRYIEVFSTGQSIKEPIDAVHIYLGTVKLLNGNLVFHIYEYKETE